MAMLSSSQELDDRPRRLSREFLPERTCIRICMTGCRAYGAAEVRSAFAEELKARGLSTKVELRDTGCQGFCARAPVVSIDPYGYFYQEVTPADVGPIVARTVLKGEILSQLLYEDQQ